MSRLSATTSLEMKILDALRALNLPVPCVGMMERADAGEQKEQDTTALILADTCGSSWKA